MPNLEEIMTQASSEDAQRIAALTAEISAIHRENERRDKKLEEMAADIKSLLALANQSRGALWVGMGLASLAGGALSWLVSHIKLS